MCKIDRDYIISDYNAGCDSDRNWYMIDGSWHHCMVTHDGKKYVDGIINSRAN